MINYTYKLTGYIHIILLLRSFMKKKIKIYYQKIIIYISILISSLKDVLGKNKNRKSDIFKSISLNIDYSNNKLSSLISKNRFFTIKDMLLWKATSEKTLQEIRNCRYRKRPKELELKIKQFIRAYNGIENYRDSYNQQFFDEELVKCAGLFNDVEGKQLDINQKKSIIKDEYSNLVVAGAGSGKTLTIIGKIKYIVEKGFAMPHEILVIAYNRAVAAEMRKRLKKEFANNIKARTFHSLGYYIISQSTNREKLSLMYGSQRDELIINKFNELRNSEKYVQLLLKYFSSYIYEYKSPFQFENEKEYRNYLKLNKVMTFNNDNVKSLEESEIANFFYINQVEYVYEKRYEHEVSTEGRKPYSPDFFLPEYNIYIEHFAIDENGNVPPFFKGKSGMSAKECYNRERDWKLETHDKYGTTLIQTFSFEKRQGKLLDNLKQKLLDKNVVLKPMTADQLNRYIFKKKIYEYEQFIKLLKNVIAFLREEDISISEVVNSYLTKKEFNEYNLDRVLLFYQLLEPIYDEYLYTLDKTSKIDYSDMINMARRHIINGDYYYGFKYIIVDEYQDISISKFRMLQALVHSSDAKQFCVGDDWQSIYRFSGSKIDLFTDFKNRVPYAGENSYIKTTYRYNKNTIDISGKFIMNNPFQLKKELSSYKQDNSSSLAIVRSSKLDMLKSFVLKKLELIEPDSSVLFLGRYREDYKEFCYDSLQLSLKPEKCMFVGRADIKVQFMTAHSAKGQEADYVFLINNKGFRGFPCTIENDIIEEYFLKSNDNYPHSEERRLFYVAITRAKKFTWLIVDEENSYKPSIFIDELSEYDGILKIQL
jgi:DNA helicase-4